MSVNLYYKVVLINKFIKYNQVNDMCGAIKYLDLYLYFNFHNFIFIYYQIFFIELFQPHDLGCTTYM